MMEWYVLNRQVRLTWAGLLVYIVLVSVLCRLGFWQLDRAEQKQHWLQQQQEALSAETIQIDQAPLSVSEDLRYHQAVVAGHYDEAHQFLLDNQIVEGKSGYFVLTPFIYQGQSRAVLVNRGWPPAGRNRQDLPDVRFSASQTQVTGRINQFPSVGIKLKGAEIPAAGWPSVVQVLDSAMLSQTLGYEVADFQLELAVDAIEGYKRDWKIQVPIPPEKHKAYAVQWFALALTLTALFIWISVRTRSEHTA